MTEVLSSLVTPISRHNKYVGRFAPSPTGPLHAGSLVAALASYLDAKAAHGTWLVRVEDLDPPREIPGATESILRSLDIHGLGWDGEILYQSNRLSAYADAFATLRNKQLIYPCRCTRKAIAAAGGVYPGICRDPKPPIAKDEAVAWRVTTSDFPAPYSNLSATVTFDDLFLGAIEQNIPLDFGDFIIKRKDGLFAYQLAVVVDDIYQHITHVVRGSDLLSSTASQILLAQLFDAIPPAYGHCPIVTNESGQKLSKQHHAVPLDNHNPAQNLWRALHFLQQAPPASLAKESPEIIIQWAIQRWVRPQPQK